MNYQAYLIKEAVSTGKFLRYLRSQAKAPVVSRAESKAIDDNLANQFIQLVHKSYAKMTPEQGIRSVGSLAAPLGRILEPLPKTRAQVNRGIRKDLKDVKQEIQDMKYVVVPRMANVMSQHTNKLKSGFRDILTSDPLLVGFRTGLRHRRAARKLIIPPPLLEAFNDL